MKKVIYRGKRSKTLSEVKPVENISKNPQSLLQVSPMQKEVTKSFVLDAIGVLDPCDFKSDFQ